MTSKNSTDRKHPRNLAAIGVAAVALGVFATLPTWSASPTEVDSAIASDAGGKWAAEKLAHEYGAWLRDAHGKAQFAGDAQPLPSQF